MNEQEFIAAVQREFDEALVQLIKDMIKRSSEVGPPLEIEGLSKLLDEEAH